MEQLSRIAIERSAEKRANFAARIGTYDANQLVFVDESAVDRRTTYRGRAWAILGKKATRKAFFCRGKRYVCTNRTQYYTATYSKGLSTRQLSTNSLSAPLTVCNLFLPQTR